MFLNFGFSYVGLIYLLMLFVPNIIWIKFKPEDYDEYAKKENKILLILEKIGEVLTCSCAAIFADFNVRITYWTLWLILSFLFMVMYEFYWIRYFRSSHTMKDMYSSVLHIPVAGATLPIIAFGLLAVYGKNPFLGVAVIILGIGHIGIHLGHLKEISCER